MFIATALILYRNCNEYGSQINSCGISNPKKSFNQMVLAFTVLTMLLKYSGGILFSIFAWATGIPATFFMLSLSVIYSSAYMVILLFGLKSSFDVVFNLLQLVTDAYGQMLIYSKAFYWLQRTVWHLSLKMQIVPDCSFL